MTVKKNILKPVSIIAMIFPGLRPASVRAQNGDAFSGGIVDMGHCFCSFVFQRVEQTFADTVDGG